MILIVACRGDEHGDEVALRLEEVGVPWRRVDPSRLHAESLYSINPAGPGLERGALFHAWRDVGAGGEESVADQRLTAIYWRRPLPSGDALAMAFPLAGEVAAAEAYHAFRLSAEALPPSLFPLGHPAAMDRASNKILQLQVARQSGFRVPDTLVGNDPEALGAFLRRYPRVVVKPLHCTASYRPQDRAQTEQLLWCRSLAAADLLPRLAPGRPAQLLVQEQIAKQADWRVTVLPGESYCCRIESAPLGPDEADWRKRTDELDHSLVEMPADFTERLRRYLKLMGLSAGYFDFALDEQGEPWFLEANTNAQWLWIERKTGAPISRAVARALQGA